MRRIYCGMVRAMDESIGNITQTYERLGILSDTLFILTGDNGGIPWNGGNNYPLRGNKATAFEGGVRSIAFACLGLGSTQVFMELCLMRSCMSPTGSHARTGHCWAIAGR